MCYAAVFWLNCFHPSPHKINNINPRTLVTGQTVNLHQHCKYEFGQYVQNHEVTDNTMTERTMGALALCLTGNSQGGYFFSSLLNDRRLNRHHVTPLPMPEELISQVHDMAKKKPTGIAILDRNNHPFACRLQRQ